MSRPLVLTSPDGSSPDDASFWEQIYNDPGGPAWDLGHAAPPIVHWFDREGAHHLPAGAQILVPGCGNGHDVVPLAQRGYRVTALDFAPSAIEGTRGNLLAHGLTAEVVLASLFDLPSQPEWRARFHAVVEHTCFCAIDPARRRDYVNAVRHVLQPGGLHVGLFYNHGRKEGPPFDTTPDSILHHFLPDFECLEFRVAQNSIVRRAGSELLVVHRLVSPRPAQGSEQKER